MPFLPAGGSPLDLFNTLLVTLSLPVSQRASAALPDNLWLAAFWMAVSLAGVMAAFTVLGLVLVYAERKVAAHFQCRLGPMRVGPHGIFQTVADTVKLLSKEDLVPTGADKLLFFLAPGLVLSGSLLAMALVPASPWLQVTDLSIGVVFVLAVGSLSVLGILLGGWSSNNKWSLLGAMRAGAQIVSYELTATLAVLAVVMLAGSMSLNGIIQSQQAGWWIWRAPVAGLLGFLLFVIASTAEVNRTPFDIPEGESELAAGFHTEFSGLRFAFFFLAEFLNMFVASAIAATLFLGGWLPFHIGDWQAFNGAMDLIPPVLWFGLKTGGLIFLMMWFRWTFPRLRVDQLMRLEWTFLLPVSLLNLLLCALLVLLGGVIFPGGF
ncbi:MAG: NADH-quinone oxidoreductase subunit NuoH [Candidatus Cloacimonetes bacterium]|nr:NADH-quinone oxidoreductase subunit NuoH [Candidatus Cloacimonadota bacterium]